MNRKLRRAGRAKGGRPSGEAERLADAGREHQAEGRLLEAVAAYREALRHDANNLDALTNLGVALAVMGNQEESPRHLLRAMHVAPRSPSVLADASGMLVQLGRWDDAMRALERCLALKPPDITASLACDTLAFIHTENGRRAEAVPLLRRAIALDPLSAGPYFRLHRALYDTNDLGPSVAAMTDAVTYQPDDDWYRLCYGFLLDQVGDAKGARAQFAHVNRDGAHAGTLASWEYVKRKRTADVSLLATTREGLHYGLDHATVAGHVLEFGVRYGITTRWIAEHGQGTVHGFDSFEGLPETWHTQPAGSYSTHGELPSLPSNVRLHVGLFDATLPEFLQESTGPIRFMNVDCDLYSSTKTIFDLVASRVVPGTVIVFDEYIGNNRWAEDEYKAFQEAVAEHGWSYEYLAFAVEDMQAVVRVR